MILIFCGSYTLKAQWTNADDMIINGNNLTSDTHNYASALTADVIGGTDGGKIHLDVVNAYSYSQIWLGLTAPGSGKAPGGYYSGFYMDFTLWYHHNSGIYDRDHIKIYVGGVMVYQDEDAPDKPTLSIEVANNQARFYVNDILWYTHNGTIPDTLLGVAQTEDDDNITLSGFIEAYSGGQPERWEDQGSNIVYDGGTVGIGTTTPDANFKLDVNGEIKSQNGNSSQWDEAYEQRGSAIVGKGLAWENNKLVFNGNTINGNGIGWDANADRLYVRGNELAGSGLTWSNNKLSVTQSSVWSESAGSVFYSGGVGIGTTTIPSGYMMAVDGHLIAEELTVEVVAGTGPDYVFEEDYDLSSLQEIEDYILGHGHLPEVPSAIEMESHGMGVGEMNLLLLKKIEELTLHLIEMEKQQNILQSKLNTLENRVNK